MDYVLRLFMLLWMLLLVKGCPKECSCDKQGHTLVDCTDTKLKTFPKLDDIPKKARHVKLPGNEISEIPALNGASGLPSVSGLWMNDNVFQQVNGTRISMAFPGLASLDLRSNRLYEIRGYYFKGLRNLALLYLDGNVIETLAQESFGDLISLQKLYISHNKICTINIDLFASLVLVDLIDMSNNEISKCVPTEGQWPPSLSYLDLSHNKLKVFPSLPGKLTRSTYWVDIRSNPLFCGCIHDTLRNMPIPSCNIQFDCWEPERVSTHSVECLTNETVREEMTAILKHITKMPTCQAPNITTFIQRISNKNNIRLDCTATGFPIPSIFLVDSNHTKVTFDPSERYISRNKTRIIYDGFPKKDYFCVAENVAGKITKKPFKLKHETILQPNVIPSGILNASISSTTSFVVKETAKGRPNIYIYTHRQTIFSLVKCLNLMIQENNTSD